MGGREFDSGRTNAQGFKITEEIKCSLCSDICKLLDSPVFSDRTINRWSRLTTLQCRMPRAKSGSCSSRCCGLSSAVYHGWEGKSEGK